MSAGVDMATIKSDIQTATQGNVHVEWAWFQNRMVLRCRACHAVFKCDLPESPDTIAWDLQQWVKRHVPGGIHDKEEIKNPMDLIPLTPTSGEVGLPDASWTKAQQIKAQMEKYKAEIEANEVKQKVIHAQLAKLDAAKHLKKIQDALTDEIERAKPVKIIQGRRFR